MPDRTQLTPRPGLTLRAHVPPLGPGPSPTARCAPPLATSTSREGPWCDTLPGPPALGQGPVCSWCTALARRTRTRPVPELLLHAHAGPSSAAQSPPSCLSGPQSLCPHHQLSPDLRHSVTTPQVPGSSQQDPQGLQPRLPPPRVSPHTTSSPNAKAVSRLQPWHTQHLLPGTPHICSPHVLALWTLLPAWRGIRAPACSEDV